jgi:hypothetical protein
MAAKKKTANTAAPADLSTVKAEYDAYPKTAKGRAAARIAARRAADEQAAESDNA